MLDIKNTLRVLIPGGWVDLEEHHEYGTIEGRSFENSLEVATSPHGDGSVIISRGSRTSASFTLSFIFYQKEHISRRINEIDGIMMRARAIEINGYTARVAITLDSEEKHDNRYVGITTMSYSVMMLDPYYWSRARYLQGEVRTTPTMRSAGSAEMLSAGERKIVTGPARWKLSITGQPTLIMVQAVRIEGGTVAYAFSAANIIYNDPGFAHIEIDNSSLEVSHMKRFEASKPSGEIQDLTNYIEVAGNGFFNLPDGRYEMTVYLAGAWDRYTLETYEGRLIPPLLEEDSDAFQ